ncbi:lipocalin family protein [Rufibacter sp. LB8]|uniref:lipocalin family protein n=1 Tax=Rufibacter sp. LB8 TaxID=2777781 RepID=UPI00178C68E0|nr:lipocalin family protein [Rufibacter sp. LB8]
MKNVFAVPVKVSLTYLLVLCLSVLSFSCNKKQEAGSPSMISGATSKVWKASKETNAAGDKESLSSEEKQQQIQFFANGNFTQTSESQSANGTWAYDDAAKNLALTYSGNSVSENFKVTEIDEDDLKLQAPDGSTLTLKAE